VRGRQDVSLYNLLATKRFAAMASAPAVITGPDTLRGQPIDRAVPFAIRQTDDYGRLAKAINVPVGRVSR
jgi:hypothetical protein